jgi:hypothetical protein
MSERDRQPSSQKSKAKPGTPGKAPQSSTAGKQAMTNAQASRLASLAAETGETFDSSLSKAEAARRIDELQRKTGREQPKAMGGDGGTSIRANESASGQDESPPRVVTPRIN